MKRWENGLLLYYADMSTKFRIMLSEFMLWMDCGKWLVTILVIETIVQNS